MVSFMFADGHSKSGSPSAVNERLNDPLPDLVLKVSDTEMSSVVVLNPLGSLSPLLMHPCVTSAVPVNVAVAVLPAPATSPLTVTLLPETDVFTSPTKCS